MLFRSIVLRDNNGDIVAATVTSTGSIVAEGGNTLGAILINSNNAAQFAAMGLSRMGVPPEVDIALASAATQFCAESQPGDCVIRNNNGTIHFSGISGSGIAALTVFATSITSRVNINTPSLTFNGGSSLTNYTDMTIATTFTGPWTSGVAPSANLHFVRCGNLVTLSVSAVALQAISTGGNFMSSVAVPASLLPDSSSTFGFVEFPIFVSLNTGGGNINSVAQLLITSTGVLTINLVQTPALQSTTVFGTANSGQFSTLSGTVPSGTTVGWPFIHISYILPG